MGNLLGSPMTEKETHVGETPEGLKFAVSSMQGWRVHMEDAHICQPFLFAERKAVVVPPPPPQAAAAPSEDDAAMEDGVTATTTAYERIDLPGHSLYAVFDGHGGSFAAEYAARNFCRVLSRQADFVEYASKVKAGAAGDKKEAHELIQSALRASFLDLDCEILRQVKRLHNPDANVPYGDALDREYHGGDTGGHVDDDDDGAGQGTAPDHNMDGAESSNRQENNHDDDDEPRPDQDEGSGTTAVLVMVTPDLIVCANAGDSRSVMSRLDNTVIPLSFDHKPDDEAEERRVRDAGGTVEGGRVEGDLAVSRGLGDFRYKEEDTVLGGAAADCVSEEKEEEEEEEPSKPNNNNKKNTCMLRPGDQKVSPVPDFVVQARDKEKDKFIILACDGIWDVKTNAEGVQLVADLFGEGEADMGLLCEEVLDECLSAGSKDNMTVLVVQMESQTIGPGGGVTTRREKRSVYVPPHKDPAHAANAGGGPRLFQEDGGGGEEK